MELSKFVPNDRKEILFLNMAKSLLDIVENTHSKPQETLEFKMNKQKEYFSFDIPLELPEKWMMGVTSLEVYNTVYNITENNNSFLILLDADLSSAIKIDAITKLFGKQILSPTPENEFLKLKAAQLSKSDHENLIEILNRLNLDI